MVIREYAACEECGQAHILRVGLGSQRLQKHLFACRECGLEMGLTLKIGEGTSFGPNAVRVAATEDAPIVNLHADFVFDATEIGSAKAFPSLTQGAKMIDAMMAARRRAGIPDDHVGPVLPPIGEEWDALRAAWALTRNGKTKLAQKRMVAFLARAPYPEPPASLADWLFQFCARLTQPAYEAHFEALFSELQQAVKSDGFEAFLDAYDAVISKEHGRRYFEMMRAYLGNFTEFSQVHGAVVNGVEVGPGQTAASLDFAATRMIYGDSFEAFAANVETLAYLNNLLAGRRWDTFATMDRARYLQLDKPSRFGPLRDNPAFNQLCSEADNRLRNATHHGGAHFNTATGEIVYHTGKGGQGPEQRLSYAEYLARTSKLFIQALTLLRLELLIADRFQRRWPL